MRAVLLVDNGSKRPESTLGLRRLAAALTERAGEPIRPVSLLHADQIDEERLEGRAAETFAPTLKRLLSRGYRDLVLIPLFFGPSRALTRYVPETAVALSDEMGPFRLRLAPELCPLPAGEPRLADILYDQIQTAATAAGITPARIVLVDHGSPLPEVNAVRRWLAGQLASRLSTAVALEEAVMERRPGPEYDFNGPLLEDLLDRLARSDAHAPALLSMLFLSPGRHAGPGGDIDAIRTRVASRYPGFRTEVSPLVGEHPGLVDLLASRVTESERWINLNPAAA